MKTERPWRDNVRQWEPHIHAFSALYETPSEGTKSGPLSGMAVGVKDSIDVAGLPTRNGSDACRDTPPAAHDANVVAALRNAGADIIGKTTTTEFAFTDPTACRNPYDVNRSPGGSSSGSGAAVAAGVVDIALGTQTAGSLCRPAAYCGAVGFKPSYGVLPTDGVTPLAPSFDTVGMIAGSVGVVQAAFRQIARAAYEAPHPEARTSLCALWDSDVLPSPDTSEAFADASSTINDLGLSSASATFNVDVDLIVAAHRVVMNFEAAAAHGAMLSDARVGMLKPKFLAGLRSGVEVSPSQAADAAAILTEAKQAFWQSLKDVDVILTLPAPEGAPLIDGTTGYQDWLTPWTVFGGPLICLPWGMDRLGRPRSVMLAAHPHKDTQLLALAARLAEQSPRLARPQMPSL
jgi:Asp-tRNA(Asn)/Glu-tRNA(Gln) amidotransferase A subunit family amidase